MTGSNTAGRMNVCCLCCLGSRLCDELITRSEEPHHARERLCMCVWPSNINNEAALVRVGLLRHKKNTWHHYNHHHQNGPCHQYHTCRFVVQVCLPSISFILLSPQYVLYLARVSLATKRNYTSLNACLYQWFSSVSLYLLCYN